MELLTNFWLDSHLGIYDFISSVFDRHYGQLLLLLFDHNFANFGSNFSLPLFHVFFLLLISITFESVYRKKYYTFCHNFSLCIPQKTIFKNVKVF